MTMHFRDLADQAAADGTIAPDAILALRRASWASGAIDAETADAIFAINDRIPEPDEEWTDYFVEAIAEFLVNGGHPAGYVDEAGADWLIAHVERDGRVGTMAELELIAKLLDRAIAVPSRLRHYALASIEQAVLTGEGPTRRGALTPGAITADEARLLRRALFAPASDRPAGIGRAEADLLFRLKDASLGLPNAPEWKQLFVQGVGNYLTGYTVHQPLSNERAAELEAFVNRPSEGVGRFLARMAHFDVQSGFAAVFGPKPARRYETEAEAAAQIDADERSWLDARTDADGEIDEFERALMAFLAEGP